MRPAAGGFEIQGAMRIAHETLNMRGQFLSLPLTTCLLVRWLVFPVLRESCSDMVCRSGALITALYKTVVGGEGGAGWPCGDV